MPELTELKFDDLPELSFDDKLPELKSDDLTELDFGEKKTVFTPISKLLTGKSILERTQTAERRQKEMQEFATKRALSGKPASVGELMLRGAPSVLAESIIDIADISPFDVGAMTALPVAGKAVGKIPFKGVPIGEIASKIPLNKRFFQNIDEWAGYQNKLRAMTPLTSRGVPGQVAKDVLLPKGKALIEIPKGVISQEGIKVKQEMDMLNAPKGALLSAKEKALKVQYAPEKKTLISFKKPQPEIKTPDFAENINLTKYPQDVRQTISDLVIQKPGLGKTPTIPDAELISRASQLKDTPTVKYLAQLPEGTVEAEALKVRQGNTDAIRQALAGELGGLKNTLDDIIQGGIGLHRKTAAMFGRGLRQQRLPAETQQQMAFAIDDTIHKISKDTVFSKDKELLDTMKKLRGMVVNKEFNPTVWNKVYFTWLNSILSNPFTHLVNTTSNAFFAMSKLPDKLASAIWDLPISRFTGKRTQFFGEIPAMVRGAFSKEALPKGLAVGTKLDMMTTPIRGKIGKVVGAPVRALQFEDDLAKGLVGRMELAAQKYAGKTGEELAQAVSKEQLYRTFQNDAGAIAEGMMFLRAKIPGLRYVIPFIRTPSNLIARGLERTPLALAKVIHKGRLRQYTQEELAKDLGNLTLGTMGAAWVGWQYAKGHITGRTPAEPAQRDAFYRQGKKPNAIKIGNKWIPLERLEPLGTSFSVMANLFNDYAQSGKETPQEKAVEAISALGKTLINKTYLSGFTGMVNALSDPEMYGKSFLTRIASGGVPQLFKFFADLKDPYYREANTVLDSLKVKTPFLSETLPPKLNVFGEPVKKDYLNIGTVKEDPLEKMIGETPVGFPSKMLGKEKLTPNEYRWLLQTTGPIIKRMLGKVSPEEFNQLPLEQREKIINYIQTSVRTIPRGALRVKRELNQ